MTKRVVSNARPDRRTKHGMHKSREYASWANMKARCLNPANDRFQSYGGRGIDVCERWRESFESFLADMGPRPPGMTLDRIDNDGNYEPGNCRWATATEQQSHTRKSRLIDHDGRRWTLNEFSREFNLHPRTIVNRIGCGWTIDRIAATPSMTRQQAIAVATAAIQTKTHCRRGHAYDATNTRTEANGKRHCVTCEALRRPLPKEKR